MQNKGIWIGLGVFLAIILVGFFLLRKPVTQTSQKQSPTPSGAAESGTPEATASAREITIIGSEYSYNPKNIQVEKGEKIKLIFRNMGAIAHNLVVEELGISTKTISKGEEDFIKFTASEGGILTFSCSIGNHKSLGMEGEIEVK